MYYENQNQPLISAIPGEGAGDRRSGVGRGECRSQPPGLSAGCLHLAAATTAGDHPAAGKGPLLHLALAGRAYKPLVLLGQAHAGGVVLPRTNPTAEQKPNQSVNKQTPIPINSSINQNCYILKNVNNLSSALCLWL